MLRKIPASPHNLAAGAAPRQRHQMMLQRLGKPRGLRSLAVSLVNARPTSSHAVTCPDCAGWLRLSFVTGEDVRIRTPHTHSQEHSDGTELWEDKSQKELLRECLVTVWALIPCSAYSSLVLSKLLFISSCWTRETMCFFQPQTQGRDIATSCSLGLALERTIGQCTPARHEWHTHFLMF